MLKKLVSSNRSKLNLVEYCNAVQCKPFVFECAGDIHNIPVLKMASYEMLSEKLKKIIVIDNYKFRFHKKLANNVDRFCCCVNICKSYIKVSEYGEIIQQPTEHNHESYDEGELVRHRISNAVKRKAATDICEKPAKLICRGITENIDIDSTLTLHDIQLIRKNVYTIVDERIDHRNPSERKTFVRTFEPWLS